MITQLQNFFLKHNKVLFGGLLVIIIVTFVLTIGPQSIFDGGQGPQQREISFFGYNLASENDRRVLAYEAEISAMLHPELGLRRNDLQRYAYERAAGLGIAAQLGIPSPDDDSLETYIETLGVFQDPTSGEFSAESYNRILEMLNSSGRYSEGDLARVLRQDYRIEKVTSALAGPLYRLDHDIKQAYIAEQTTYDVALAKFAYADFNPELSPSSEDLQNYYNENPSAYEEPTKIRVSALYFEGSRYVDEIDEPSQTALENYFSSNQSKYQPASDTEASDSDAEETPQVLLADVREQVIADWKQEEAEALAGEKAEAFSLRLWEEQINLDSDSYAAALEDFEVNVVPVPPYPRGESPFNPRIPSELLNSMWIYENSSRYFSDLAENRDGAVLLVYHETIPNRLPSFDEVVTEVRQEFISQERRRLFSEKGTDLFNQLEEAVAAGSAFQESAESLGLTVEDLESFEGSSVPPSISRSLVWSQGQYLASGDLSNMVISADEGTFLFMQSKESPELLEESEEFLAYKERWEELDNTFIGRGRLQEITTTTRAALLPEEPGN